MNYPKLIILIALILVFFLGYFAIKDYSRTESFEQARSGILTDINDLLEKAEESGEYKCCIEPPCKMCFLGNWIFESGKCDCDRFIAQGDLDNVCPECRHGIEQGECQSTLDTCSVEI
jgi:hypothetical protein